MRSSPPLSSWTPLLLLFGSVGEVHSTLVRRASHSSTVVGDYIYVDGGQFSQIVDGDYLLNIETHTLSIPLDTSWSPANVQINIINKTEGAPLLNDAKIWTSPNAEGFYSYGGEISSLSQGAVPPRALWNFTADGKGGGTWANQTNTVGDSFTGLIRTVDGASDVLGNTAYYLGGISSMTSDLSKVSTSDNQAAVSGLVSFDMDTGVWGNNTAGGYVGTGMTTNSSMVHVPRFGTEGLLVVMGGISIGADPVVTDGNAPYMSFGNISIFDPAANSWYSQTATGNIPEEREKFCVVGVEAADNSSYEIYIYGGARITPTNNATWTTINNELDEVFVLSLPKFEWVKANYTAKQNRYSHTCLVAGNRQMISIGGIDGTKPDLDGYNITDPFPQALGIFDLTEMAWVENFTHDAAPYERPAAIEALYSGNDSFPSTWSSPAVEKLFTNTGPAQNPPESPSPPPSPPSSSSPPPPSPPKNKPNTNLKTGVIIGAISSALALIALLSLLLLWHHRSQKAKRRQKVLDQELKYTIMHDQISRPIPIAQVSSLDNEDWMKLGIDVGNGMLRGPVAPLGVMRSSSVYSTDQMELMGLRRSFYQLLDFGGGGGNGSGGLGMGHLGRPGSWSREELGDGLPRAI